MIIPRKDWPIVVGGCHRSGTSLVRRVLNAHSTIHCGPEIKFLRDFFNDYKEDPLVHLRFSQSARSILDEEELLNVMGKAFLVIHEIAAKKHGKHRWADKNPENVLYLDTWQKLLGTQWMFVHVVRDPLDNIASMKEADFPLTLPEDLDGLVKHYRNCMDAGAAFEKGRPDQYHRIVYEELVTDPEKTIQDLMKALDANPEPGQLRFNEADHAEGLEDPKIGETDGFHTSSIGRWQGVLSAEEAERIREQLLPVSGKIDS